MEPRDAVGRQYQRLMGMHGARLEFTDGALRAIARATVRRGTARAGYEPSSSDFVDAMFEVPDAHDVEAVVVDEVSVARGLERKDCRERSEGHRHRSGVDGGARGRGARLVFRDTARGEVGETARGGVGERADDVPPRRRRRDEARRGEAARVVTS